MAWMREEEIIFHKPSWEYDNQYKNIAKLVILVVRHDTKKLDIGEFAL